MPKGDFIKCSRGSPHTYSAVFARRPLEEREVVAITSLHSWSKRTFGRRIHHIPPVYAAADRNNRADFSDSCEGKSTLRVLWKSFYDNPHMVSVIMGNHCIVKGAPGLGRQEMANVIGHYPSRRNVGGRLRRSQRIAMILQLIIERIGSGSIYQ